MNLPAVDAETVTVGGETRALVQAPANLRIIFGADGHGELTWDPVPGADNYEVRTGQFRRGSSFSTRLEPTEVRVLLVRGSTAEGEVGPWSKPLITHGPPRSVSHDESG